MGEPELCLDSTYCSQPRFCEPFTSWRHYDSVMTNWDYERLLPLRIIPLNIRSDLNPHAQLPSRCSGKAFSRSQQPVQSWGPSSLTSTKLTSRIHDGPLTPNFTMDRQCQWVWD